MYDVTFRGVLALLLAVAFVSGCGKTGASAGGDSGEANAYVAEPVDFGGSPRQEPDVEDEAYGLRSAAQALIGCGSCVNGSQQCRWKSGVTNKYWVGTHACTTSGKPAAYSLQSWHYIGPKKKKR